MITPGEIGDGARAVESLANAGGLDFVRAGGLGAMKLPAEAEIFPAISEQHALALGEDPATIDIFDRERGQFVATANFRTNSVEIVDPEHGSKLLLADQPQVLMADGTKITMSFHGFPTRPSMVSEVPESGTTGAVEGSAPSVQVRRDYAIFPGGEFKVRYDGGSPDIPGVPKAVPYISAGLEGTFAGGRFSFDPLLHPTYTVKDATFTPWSMGANDRGYLSWKELGRRLGSPEAQPRLRFSLKAFVTKHFGN